MAGKGQPKSGGRKKGSVNKATSELADMMKARFPNYDPVMAMAAIAQDDSVEIQHRVTCHKEVAQYFRPKLRATEIRGSIQVGEVSIGKPYPED